MINRISRLNVLFMGSLAICLLLSGVVPVSGEDVAVQPPPAIDASDQAPAVEPAVQPAPAVDPGIPPAEEGVPVQSPPPVEPDIPTTVPVVEPDVQPAPAVDPGTPSTGETPAPVPVVEPISQPLPAIDPTTLPTGGTITAGSGSISANGASMTISQQTQRMVAHWSTFNIGENASVRFQQPDSESIALNRIHDQNPSLILGSLSANGQIFLINPSGIIFGETARVDVGGIVASTLAISDEEFMRGHSTFDSSTPEEEPTITGDTPTSTQEDTTPSTAPDTAGATGSPEGSSTAPVEYSLIPPETATGDPAALSPEPPASIKNQAVIRTAKGGYVAFIAPQTVNEGEINAQEGGVVMAGGEKVSLSFTGDKLINYSVEKGAVDALAANKGLIKADGGMVVLTAKAVDSLTQAVVNNSSIIEARGLEGKNGRIVLDAEGGQTRVSGALDASNADGRGGEIVATGDQVLIASNARLDASGSTGGGEVLIGGGWQGGDPAIHRARNTVVEQGALIKADATAAGKGGTVVTWADETTSFAGTISAKGGINGGDGGNAEVSGKERLNFAGLVDLTATAGKTGDLLLDPANFTIGSDITGAALGAQLDLTNVIVQTGSDGGNAGNITVSEGVAWTSATTLFMKAHNSILVNEAIANSGGGQLILRADSDANSSGTVLFGASGQVAFTGGGSASLYYNPTGGYTTPTNYTAEFTGVTPTAYMLVNNLDQLQAMNTNLAGVYALGKDIDASATAGWGSGNSKGFDPIGTPTALGDGVSAPLYITFDGNGHTISDLYIYRPTMAYVGLFRGSTDGAPIFRNIWLEDVNITGGFQTGGAVAHLGLLPGGAGGHGISNSYVTGSVTGSNNVGGLVGLSAGPITNSYSKATVHGSTWVGGLVGTNWGNAARVTNSYSAGAVSGSSHVGGLVGYNYNTIATPVSNSYWDTQTSGQATSAGGAGRTTAQMKTLATFPGWDFTNTWGIQNGTSYPYLTGGTMGMSGTTVTLTSTTPTPDPPPAPSPGSPAAADTGTVVQDTGDAPSPSPRTVTIEISATPTPDTSAAEHIAEQIAANDLGMPGQQATQPFASLWNLNVPYYSSWDDYMQAHPPLVISWTDQAKHYASWTDYLVEHPWYVTAIAMNRSPQVDAEGRFIDGLVGPLDYLTTVGSGGIGFAGLEQGGDYQGYTQTSGSYLTEMSWRANELDRLMETLSAETAYDPEVAKMWEDAAVAKAKKNEAWQTVLDDLLARGIDENILDLLTPKSPKDLSLADLLQDTDKESVREQLDLKYRLLSQEQEYRMEKEKFDSLISNAIDEFLENQILKAHPAEEERAIALNLQRRMELGLPLPDEKVLNIYGLSNINENMEKQVKGDFEGDYSDVKKTSMREQLDLKYRLLQQEREYANTQEIIGKANEYKEVSDEYGNLSLGYFEDLARKKYEKVIENEVNRYEVLGKESPEAGLVTELAWRELENYVEERKVALEKFEKLSASEKAELLKNENLSDGGRAALSDKNFKNLVNQLIPSVFSENAGFACIPIL